VPATVVGAAPGSAIAGAAPGNSIPTAYFTPSAAFQIDPMGKTWFDSVYHALVAAAAVALAGGQIIRLVAVKLR
jgi:hypothetical protein